MKTSWSKGVRKLLFSVLILVTLTAGCVSVSSDYYFGGHFTAEASQADLTEFRALTGSYGAELLIMESFPMQFQVNDLTEENCNEMQPQVSEFSYVRTASECRLREVLDNLGEVVESRTPIVN